MTSIARDHVQVSAPAPRAPHVLLLPAGLLVLDFVILAATGLLALLGRERLDFFDTASGVRQNLPLVGALILVAWIGCVGVLGGYRRDVLGAGPDEFKRVLNASLLTAGVTGVNLPPVPPPPARRR